MFTKRQVGLVAAALASLTIGGAAVAATSSSTMTVSATLTSACTVSSTSAIAFGSFAALASTGDKTANSGSTFQVACSASASPTIYAVGTRSMSDGVIPSLLPFNLSLTSGAAANDLPLTQGTATALTVTQDGDLHDVVIYAKTLASNFKSLPSGPYTTTVTVSVDY